VTRRSTVPRRVHDLINCENCTKPVNLTNYELNPNGGVICKYKCGFCGHITTKIY